MSIQWVRRKFNRSNVRRMIRGRAYTTIAQIRRYFGIESEDVTLAQGPQGRVFIALPTPVAHTIALLWREGKIGVQLSLNVRAAVVVGVYSTETPVHVP